MDYKTISIFVDVDTGEVLPYCRKEQLKYTDYRIINIVKKFNYDNEKSECTITRTNECKHGGQRTINFGEHA